MGTTAVTQANGARMEADERRRQLLDVARRLFSERPYGAVSVEEIAAEAGVARGLVNHYFGNKRDLYVEVVRKMMRVPPPPLPELIEEGSPRQRVKASLDAWLEMIERNRATWLDSIRSQGLGDSEIAAILEDAREEAAMRMLALLGHGSGDWLEPERIAMMRAYGGLAEAATVQWLEHGRLSREQTLELLVESATRLARRLFETVAAAGLEAQPATTSTNETNRKATRSSP